jgi:phosphate starvation-inducible protein PhoH
MSRNKRKRRKDPRAQNRQQNRPYLRPTDIINKITPKTEGQEIYLDSIEDNPITICDAPAGSGKAQPLDALVLTKNGYRKMGDIKIGDMVANQNGGFSKVKAVYPQGKKDVFEVKFSDGTSTECCKEHLWYTWTSRDRDEKREGSVKSLEEMMQCVITKNNKKNHSIPMCKPVNFEKKNLPIEPYLMGVILGDGGMSGANVSISSADQEIVELVSAEVSKVGTLSLNKTKHGKYDYLITNKGMRGVRGITNPIKDDLRTLKLFGKKSHQKFIPNAYKYSSVEDRISVFQGLMDTDGTTKKSNTRNSVATTFTSTSEQLALDVKFLVESLGGKASMKDRVTTYTYKEEKKNGRRSYRLNISLPEGINPFKLKRKGDIYKPHKKYKPTRYISSIEKVGEEECQCISVDNKEGLYLTNNFIVTHNTFIAFGKALEYYLEPNAIDRIVVVRSTHTAGDEPGIGFLPGDLHDKMGPFLAPILKDSAKQLIKKMQRDYEVQNLLSSGGAINSASAIMQVILSKFDIEIVPIQFMRGRTFANSFVILDEAQNCSLADFKLFLTRIGENSKVIIEGDASQTDRPEGALPELMRKLEVLDTVGCIRMDGSDIVRSPLIADILYALDR